MDRSKKKDDKQSLYEIYRACRLCGAGGGYKMPIVQNFLQIDGEEIDLKQKIRECLQLEINLDDRMPPLICELCVDKVNDFYDFLNVCKRTNKQTRMRLGLPLKIASKDSATETCMLGLVEALALKVETEEPPLKKKKIKVNNDVEPNKQEPQKIPPKDLKDKITLKETKVLEKQKPNKEKSLKDIKTEKEIKESFENDKGKKETPKRTTRNSLEDLVLTKVQEFSRKPAQKAGPKSMLKERKDLKEMIAYTEEEPNTKLKREESFTKLKREEPNTKLKREEPNTKLKREEPIAKLKREEPNTKLKREEPNPKLKREEPNTKLKREEPNTKLKREEPNTKLKREEPNPKLKREEPNPKLKRSREKETKELPPPTKKNKPDPKSEKTTPPKPLPTEPTPKTAPVSKKVQPANKMEKVADLAKPDKYQCPACSSVLKNNCGFVNHMKFCHPVTLTSDNLACNACREWFPSIEDSVAHHKKHAHYKCLKCNNKFKNGVHYHLHIEKKKCVPETEVPDEKCSACWRLFPTKNLLSQHRCLGTDGRPGGKCSKCNRNYTLLKNLKKHESTCTFSQFMKTAEPIIDPEVKESLLPMEVRISKCDDLLEYGPVVSACTVPHRYGLDSKRSYPYMPKLRVIKKPSFIPTPEQNTTDFGPSDLEWDDFLNTRNENTVKKLSTLSLKVLFSENMLGDKLVLDEKGYQKRLSLKRKINSIIFKYDDSNSCDSNSILEKNVATNFKNVVSNLKDSEKSDSTVYDEIASDFRSNDDASSDKIQFDDLRFDNIDRTDNNCVKNDDADSQNDDLVSKNDEKDSQNDDSVSENVSNLENDHNIVVSKDDQNTVTDVKMNENNDDTDSNTVNQIDSNIDVNNDTLHVNMLKLDQSTINKTGDSDSENIDNQTNSNNDYAPLADNETGSKFDDKNDQNSSFDETDLVKTEQRKLENTKNSNLDITSTNSTEEKSLNESTAHDIDNISTNSLHSSKNINSDSPSNITKVIESDDTVNYIHDGQQESNVNKSDNTELNHETESLNTENNNTSNDTDFENNLSVSMKDIHDFLTNTESKDNQHSRKDPKSISDKSENLYNNLKEDILNKESKTNEMLDIVDKGSGQNESTVNSFKTRDLTNDSKSGNDLNDDTEVSNSINDNDKNLDSKNDKIVSKTNENDSSIDISNKNENTNDSPTKNTNFSITSILKDDNSNPDNTNDNIETRNNVSNNKNDNTTKKQTDNFLDNISLNEATDDSCSTKENDRKNDDSLSLSSLKFIDTSIDIDKIDKFNVNDLSEDEKRLMAELDEQIGENNDKTDFDALSDNYDFNV